jgi:hypothetical protein
MRSSNIFREPRTSRAVVRRMATPQSPPRDMCRIRERIVGRLRRAQGGASAISTRPPRWGIIWMMDDWCPGRTGHHSFVPPDRAGVGAVAYFFAKVLGHDARTAVEALVIRVKGRARHGSLGTGELLRRHAFTERRRQLAPRYSLETSLACPATL